MTHWIVFINTFNFNSSFEGFWVASKALGERKESRIDWTEDRPLEDVSPREPISSVRPDATESFEPEGGPSSVKRVSNINSRE